MPAVDRCEPQIIRALEKEGWRVVRRHVSIRVGKRGGQVFADLRLQKNDLYLMIVEMKCLAGSPFPMNELYKAIGQYEVYQNALQFSNIFEPLYLALPNTAYQHCVAQDAIHATLVNAKIRMIVVDLQLEEIMQWIH